MPFTPINMSCSLRLAGHAMRLAGHVTHACVEVECRWCCMVCRRAGLLVEGGQPNVVLLCWSCACLWCASCVLFAVCVVSPCWVRWVHVGCVRCACGASCARCVAGMLKSSAIVQTGNGPRPDAHDNTATGVRLCCCLHRQE